MDTTAGSQPSPESIAAAVRQYEVERFYYDGIRRIQEVADHLRRAEYDPGAPFTPPPSLRLP